MRVSFGLVALALCAACSTQSAGPPVEPCVGGFLGDPARPPDLDFLVVNADYEIVPLHDGDMVPMLTPPQGGRVVFVGLRATNVDGCGLQLTGALRDEGSQNLRLDSRTINLIPSGDGGGATGLVGYSADGIISNFSNIPVCPNEWSSSNLYGLQYALQMTIQDRGGRTLTKTIHVTPICGEPATLADCKCTCAHGYELGASCPSDG